MANEIDQLMTLDPLELSSVDIDKIIDYLRGSYKNHEASAKFSKTGQDGDRPKVDLLKSIGLKKEAPAITRRRV